MHQVRHPTSCFVKRKALRMLQAVVLSCDKYLNFISKRCNVLDKILKSW